MMQFYTIHTMYTSPFFRLLDDVHPTIADATAQIIRDVCKDIVKLEDGIGRAQHSGNPECLNRLDDRYEVYIDIPGVKKENMDMGLDVNGLVTISASRNMPNGSVKKYEHSLMIPDDVDTELISASLEDGVLCVRLPVRNKNNASPKRKIVVS